MSLWTPYLPEPMDLSQSSRTVKPETPSPSLSGGFSDQGSWTSRATPSPPETVPSSQQSPQPAPSRPLQPVAIQIGVSKEEQEIRYQRFRLAMLEARMARNGGTLTTSNPRMRRAVRRTSGASDDQLPEDYRQRRERNNAAAKRSRDMRRFREAEQEIRIAFLEAENRRLKEIVDQIAVGNY